MKFYVATRARPEDQFHEFEMGSLDEALVVWRIRREVGDYQTLMYYRTAA